MSINNEKQIVIDFDRTIFDSDLLYQDLYSLCEKGGISRNFLNYSLGLVPPKNLLFNFFLMVERSQAIEYSQLTKLIYELKTFLRSEGQKYVFPDVSLFLNSARREGYQIVILTYGDFDFQLAKYVGSGLSLLGHNFIITSNFKWRHPIMWDSPSIIFLDDNPRDIDGVKCRFPSVTAVEIKRLNSKYFNVYSSRADLVISRLSWPLVK